jgi:hypothetical protein
LAAIDERAAAFCQRFFFPALASTPRALMVPLGELRAAGY